MKKYISRVSIFLLLLLPMLLPAQHVFQITGGKLVMKSKAKLVLHDASWGNHGGEILTESGTVVFQGTQTDTLGGSDTTVFGRLKIAKNGGQLQLQQATRISDSLALALGLISLGEHNLSLESTAKTHPGSANSYVLTDGPGLMEAEVSSQERLFPVGGNNFRPARLKTQQGSGIFGVKTSNALLGQGATGAPLTEDGVAASWWIEPQPGSNPQTGPAIRDVDAWVVAGGGFFTKAALAELWQSFTADTSGKLTQIEVSHFRTPINRGRLRILEGEGLSGKLLHEQAIGNNANGRIIYTLTEDIFVTEGQQYTFSMTDSANSFAIVLNTGNPYSGGRLDINPNFDARFRTYVEPFTTPAVQVDLQWNGSEELPGFTNYYCYVSRYQNGWDQETPGSASGTDPYRRARSSFEKGGIFAVLGNDDTAPQLNCPASITQHIDPGTCGAVVSYASPTATDNAGFVQVQLSNGPASGSLFPVGSTSISYMATDQAGNTASCSFDITVVDNENPTITCPPSQSLSNDADQCGAVTTYAAITTSDNCPNESLSQIAGQASGSNFPIGVTTNTFRVTDASGNTATCSFNVTVTDNEDPGIHCPGPIQLGNDPGQCGAVASFSVTTSDNCPNESLSQIAGQASGSSFPVGVTTNTFRVTDASGNTATCSFDVSVSDTEDPEIHCPANIQLSNDPGQCARLVTYIEPVGEDNCNSNTLRTTGLGSGANFPLGMTTETFVVTDASNRSASCAFTITITDDEKPIISLLGANPLILCQGETYVEAGASATDNCDPQVGQGVQVNSSTVNSLQEGSYSVTYDVTDASGNMANQVTRTVIVRATPAQLAPQNCGSCAQIRFDFCEGDAAPDLEALLTANANYESGVSFLWYADNSNSQGSPISRPTPNMARNNTRFYWVSQSINNCESEARRVRVRVRKTSTVVLDLPVLGCGAAQIDLAAWVSDSRGIATGFTFYDADPSASSGQSPTLGTSPLGTVTATQGVVNNGQYAIVSLPASPVTYYAVASNNTGCQVTGSDEVSAVAGASLDPVANITVNSGDLVQVNFSSPDATHILWLNHSSFNNPYIGLIGSIGFGNLLFTANNPASSPQTAMLRAIAYNGNCAGQVRDFYITVNPGVSSRQSAANRLELTARKVNAHDVRLDWQIEYEFALESIELEKQINGGEWHGVGSGHDLTLQEGSYLDRSGMGNETKYRLKLIHADGRVIWSQEVEINFDYYNTERFTLYPNPSEGRFKLRVAGELEGEWRYKLSDQLGRTILIGKLQDSETAFDISHLPTAHYFLLLTSPEGKRYVERVVKK